MKFKLVDPVRVSGLKPKKCSTQCPTRMSEDIPTTLMTSTGKQGVWRNVSFVFGLIYFLVVVSGWTLYNKVKKWLNK